MHCRNKDCIQCLKSNKYGYEHFGKTEIDSLKKDTQLLIKRPLGITLPDIKVTVGFDECNNLKVYGAGIDMYLCDLLYESAVKTVSDVVVMNHPKILKPDGNPNFKVWDTMRKRFLNKFSITCCRQRYVIHNCEELEYAIFDCEALENMYADDYVLVNCTGLSADKSYRGEEPADLLIFEKDLVKDELDITWEVYWDTARLAWVCKGRNSDMDMYLMGATSGYLEIIGTALEMQGRKEIYEEAEALLRESKNNV